LKAQLSILDSEVDILDSFAEGINLSDPAAPRRRKAKTTLLGKAHEVSGMALL
jgi:hypothetical protein